MLVIYVHFLYYFALFLLIILNTYILSLYQFVYQNIYILETNREALDIAFNRSKVIKSVSLFIIDFSPYPNSLFEHYVILLPADCKASYFLETTNNHFSKHLVSMATSKR